MPTHKALYRKYRPTTLDQVIGQDSVTAPLKEAIRTDRFSHAYLFIGPRGTGKTSVARIFAHAINHFDYQIEDHYTDIIELDAASHTSVDDIRELCEKTVIAPTEGKYKVYIIDEVHMLSKSAFNALLKTLEEPPAHVVFLLATTNPEKVPITIRSRTQTLTFSLASPEVMANHLSKIAKSEKIKIDQDALALIAERGGGSFRDSLSVLDQLAATFSTQEITAETVEKALGLPQAEQVQNLLKIYQTANLPDITRQLQAILATGIQPKALAVELIQTIINHPEPAYLPLLDKLTNIGGDFAIARLLLALSPVYPAPTQSLPSAPTNHQPLSAATPVTPAADPAKTASVAPQQPLEPTSQNCPPSSPTPASDASKTAPEPASAPNLDNPQSKTSETTATPPAHPATFDFSTFRESFHAEHAALYSQLGHADFSVDDQTLHLYPQSKICRKILTTPASQRLLSDATQLTVVVHEPNENPSPINQISAIMGAVQEVKIDGGEPAPFE